MIYMQVFVLNKAVVQADLISQSGPVDCLIEYLTVLLESLLLSNQLVGTKLVELLPHWYPLCS